MRVKVTTEIDINLKMMFEATKDQHKRSYKDILEQGIADVLKQYDPINALRARIELKEKELAEDREQLARMRVLEPQQKHIVEYEAKHEMQLKLTEEWFSKDPESRIQVIEKGAMNWRGVADKIGAASPREAQEWVMEVVNRWKAKYEMVIS